jgi:hypothetical protein
MCLFAQLIKSRKCLFSWHKKGIMHHAGRRHWNSEGPAQLGIHCAAAIFSRRAQQKKLVRGNFTLPFHFYRVSLPWDLPVSCTPQTTTTTNETITTLGLPPKTSTTFSFLPHAHTTGWFIPTGSQPEGPSPTVGLPRMRSGHFQLRGAVQVACQFHCNVSPALHHMLPLHTARNNTKKQNYYCVDWPPVISHFWNMLRIYAQDFNHAAHTCISKDSNCVSLACISTYLTWFLWRRFAMKAVLIVFRSLSRCWAFKQNSWLCWKSVVKLSCTHTHTHTCN